MGKEPLQDRALGFMEPFLEAENGDFRRVADMLERREWLPDEVLRLIAEQLRNPAAPNRRTRQQQKKEFDVYCRVQDLIESGKHNQSAAIDIVAKENNKSPEAIKGYLANVKKGK